MPLFDPTLLLLGQSPKDPSQFSSDHTKEGSSSILRNEDDVVFALPAGMTQTLIIFHGSCVGYALWTAHDRTPMGDCTKSQTLRVSPAEPGDFLLAINRRNKRQSPANQAIPERVDASSRCGEGAGN